MANYDRHRALAEARTIAWHGQEFQYSPEFALQLLLAQAALRPDGVFEAKADHVDIVVGNAFQTVRLGEVEELLDLAQEASVKVQRVINGVRAAPQEGTL